MFGPSILIASLLYANARSRTGYLPAGANWKNAYTGAPAAGGTEFECDAPIDIIPVFIRDDADIPLL